MSKIEDYLVDNLCASMLSEVKAGGQEQSGGAADAVPIWDCRAHPFRTEREKGWGAGEPATGLGLDPGLGVMHPDGPVRDSLAYDLMEPVARKLMLTCWTG